MDSNLDFQPSLWQIYNKMPKEGIFKVLSTLIDADNTYMNYYERMKSISVIIWVLQNKHNLTIEAIVSQSNVKNTITNLIQTRAKISSIINNPVNDDVSKDYWLEKDDMISDILYMVWVDEKWTVIKNYAQKIK